MQQKNISRINSNQHDVRLSILHCAGAMLDQPGPAVKRKKIAISTWIHLKTLPQKARVQKRSIVFCIVLICWIFPVT